MIKAIAKVDPNMFFLVDSRGCTPLQYARKDRVKDWVSFLENHVDDIWPERDEDMAVPGKLMQREANTRPVQDPINALPSELASMVVHGKITPQEASILNADKSMGDDVSSSSYDSGSDCDDSESWDSEDESDASMSEDSDVDKLLEQLPSLLGNAAVIG